ncbi:MAG TPA: hypothetical protein VHM70_03030 [Polyangiaceae bacterium]|nr:hypothetical protein [Polyangiaceae bacterium]
MTERTRFLSASFLSLAAGLFLGACNSSDDSTGTTGVGATAATDSTAGGGLMSAPVPSSGVPAGGGTVVGAGTNPPTTGGTPTTGVTTVSPGVTMVNPGPGMTTVSPVVTTSTPSGTTSSPGMTTSTPGGTSSTPAGGLGPVGGAGGMSGGPSPDSSGMPGGMSGSPDGMSSGPSGPGGPSPDADGNCMLPDLPDSSALTYQNDKLPDPFTFYDGTKVTTKAQWTCRAKEIRAMAAKYIYGPDPGNPDSVSGTVSGGTVNIMATVGSKTESFTASISGSGDVIALDLSSGILPSGAKKLSFGTGFADKIKSLYGLSELNPNIANGWMIDRVMDVLEQNPDSGHDPTKMVVSGCSGCGKGAFLAGVFSRVPMTVIVESGGGGAANLRQAEWFRHGDGKSTWMCADDLPQSIDNLEDNGICGPWVTSAAKWLRDAPAKVKNLPFDQHLMLASIAPRYLVHFSNNNGTNSWCHLGGTCEALSSWAAKPVWKALGVPERMGFHMYSSGHCGASGDQIALAGEMFKRAFQGDTSAKTDVMEIMDNGVQQPVADWQDMWVDWDMDTVLQ